MQQNDRKNANISYSGQRKVIQNNHTKFSQQEVTFDDTPLYLPRGLEKIFLLLYFITLPYLTGLLFLFFYIRGEGFSLLSATYIFTWIIGYEILAIISLLWILKKAITFTMETSSAQNNSRNFTQQ